MPAQEPSHQFVHRKCGLALCDCPYERRDAAPGFEGFAHAASGAGVAAEVEQLLQERTAQRLAKRWSDADAVLRKLAAMGVTVDDQEHSWSAGPPPPEAGAGPLECEEQTADGALAAMLEWAAGGAAAGSEIAFRGLGSDDRNTVRLAALQRGLKGRSKGKGSRRHLVVTIPDEDAATAAAATAGGGAQSAAAAAEDGARTANLFVMVLLSSSSRMRAHLQSSWLANGPVEMTGGDQRIQGGRNDGFDLLAGRSSAAADVAAELVADTNLACPLRKVFVVDDNPEPHLTLTAAVAALVTALDSTAAATAAGTAGRGKSEKVGVRLQVWPKTLLQGVLGALPPQPEQWELSPQTTGDGSIGLVGSVVVLSSGALKVGVSGAATYAGNSRETDVRGAAAAETAAAEAGADGSTDSDASSSSSAAAAAAAASVCRAFYKLQEAVQIAGVDERFVFKGAMAIDAGAAPGGWTKYLALDRGCEKVWAVDPADMELGDPLPGNIVHVRGKIQEALPVIAAELQAAGRQLDIFVTDLCPHNDTELMEVLHPLLKGGILRPGGLMIVTFKFGSGYTEETWDRMAAQQAAQLDGLLEKGATRVVHLMANRLRERTLIGYAAAAPGPE